MIAPPYFVDKLIDDIQLKALQPYGDKWSFKIFKGFVIDFYPPPNCTPKVNLIELRNCIDGIALLELNSGNSPHIFIGCESEGYCFIITIRLTNRN